MKTIMSNTQTSKLLTITPKAAEKVLAFMKEETDNQEYLRIYVQGGGCSGLSYGMSFEQKKEDDDILIEENGIKVLVDSYSQDYL